MPQTGVNLKVRAVPDIVGSTQSVDEFILLVAT